MIDRLWFLQLLHEKDPAKGWDRLARAWYERMEREQSTRIISGRIAE